MYAIVAAVALPVGVIALNLFVASHDSERIHASARHVAFVEAGRAVQRIMTYRYCMSLPPTGPNGTYQCIGLAFYGQNVAPPARAYACGGPPQYATQPQAVMNPPQWPTTNPQPDELTVTQTITCPGLLVGSITATESVTVPVPP